MRILYHHRTQGREPESVHIAGIVDALKAMGHDVLVVGPAPVVFKNTGDAIPTFAGRVKRAAPRFIFEFLQLGYNAVVFGRVRRAILSFKPDFIYERYALFNFGGLVAAKQQHVPLFLEVNTPYAEAWVKYFGLHLKKLASWIELKILLNADHIFTVTQVQARQLQQRGVLPARISVCHNAIDPADFVPAGTAERTASCEAYGLKGTVVGFVGTMNRWQGMGEFPAVLQEVLTRAVDVNFLFVGDGEFRVPLEEFCAREGFANRVIFTGRMPHAEIPRLLSAIDIAILLNSNEYGSPMKIFEYWAMAKAVIAPSVAPVCEVMRDGLTGLLISPGDAKQMAQKILMLVQNPTLRQKIGDAGRAYVVENHTWHKNACKIVDAFQKPV